MNDSVVLSLILGDNFVKSTNFQIFLESSRLIDNADKYAIVDNLSEESRQTLQKYNFNTIDIELILDNDQRQSPVVYDFALIRTKAYYKFLVNNPQYKNVLLTDSGDVLFQGNPFDIDHKNKAWFTSEGATYGKKSAPMNNGDQRVLKETLLVDYPLENCQVINSSIQYGSAEYIKQSLLLTYTTLICTRFSRHDMSIKNKCGWVSDQGIINFLYYAFLRHDPNFGLLTPDTSSLCAHMWALSEGMSVDNYDIKILEDPFTIVNKYTNEKYIILHQWNRCKPPDLWEGNARPNHQEINDRIIKDFLNAQS